MIMNIATNLPTRFVFYLQKKNQSNLNPKKGLKNKPPKKSVLEKIDTREYKSNSIKCLQSDFSFDDMFI